MKTCTKCGEAKGLDAFYAHPTGADGLMSRCKACVAVVSRDRYESNKARALSLAKQWAARNPEKVKGAKQKWKAANRDKVLGDAKSRYHGIQHERLLALMSAAARRQIATLGDCYVRAKLGLVKADAPKVLVEMKRGRLVLHRLHKELLHAITEKERPDGNA